MTSTAVTYDRYTVTYLNRAGAKREAGIRIRSDIDEADRPADARRQLVGNHTPVSDIVRVVRD